MAKYNLPVHWIAIPLRFMATSDRRVVHRTMNLPSFSNLVEESWLKAVSYAASNIERYRDELIRSLNSENPNVRSAAVTSFIEAKDPTVHDQIIKLLDDPDWEVRREVLEYLVDFGEIQDIKKIFPQIGEDLGTIFLKTLFLTNVTGREDGLILDDDHPLEIKREIAIWKKYLIDKGYI